MKYDFETSVTFTNYTTYNHNNNGTHSFYNNGFGLDAAYGVDQFCSPDTQFCWTSVVFGNVIKQYENHWFKYEPLRNIGGSFGVAYNNTDPDVSSKNTIWT